MSELLDPEELEEVALHEASHAAAALLLGRRIEHIEVKRERVPVGGTMGECRVPIGAAGLDVSQLPVALSARMLERKDWPPPYEDARSERLEALNYLVGGLGLDAPNYDRLVGLARRVVSSPTFLLLRRAIADALIAKESGRLESDDIHELVKNWNPKGAQTMDTTNNGHRRIERKSFATRWSFGPDAREQGGLPVEAKTGLQASGPPRSEKAIERPLRVASFEC